MCGTQRSNRHSMDPSTLFNADTFKHGDHIHCLILRDHADPGFPSFPVIRSDHVTAFGGNMVPKALLNQGGDPFLMELYRSIGGVQSMHAVTVVNQRGEVSNTVLYNVIHICMQKLRLDSAKLWLSCSHQGNYTCNIVSLMLQGGLSFTTPHINHLCTSACLSLTLSSSISCLYGRVTFREKCTILFHI